MSKFFLENWQRKSVAFLTALFIWLFVNHSITDTKVIPNVPIRIIKLPDDKTVSGLLPNGLLKKRITLTLTGSRNVIEELEPGDLEVIIDASTIDRDDWIVRVGKKNLKSLNPSIDLSHHINSVANNEFVLKLSRIVTAKIPLIITEPIGDVPAGYEFLDVWPKKLTQTVSGPIEEIQYLRSKGLKVTFDLSKITTEELDKYRREQGNKLSDEVSFPVPEEWRKVKIAFLNNASEDFNDPELERLQIDFLKKDILPVEKDIPIRVFYPLEHSETINPQTYPLAVTESKVEVKNGITIYSSPLYMKDVSHLFLDVIRDSIEIDIVAAPKEEREVLEWSSDVVDPDELEDTYVAYMISNGSKKGKSYSSIAKEREEVYRKRFRKYLDRSTLWTTPNQKLSLEPVLEKGQIRIK